MHEIIDLLSSSPPRETITNGPLAPLSRPDDRPRIEWNDSKVFVSASIDVEDIEDFVDAELSNYPKTKNSRSSLSEKPRPATLTALSLEIGSDDFDDSKIFEDNLLNHQDNDFPIEQSSKRRKIGSTRIARFSPALRSSVKTDAIFELSSEPDLPVSPRVHSPVNQQRFLAFDSIEYDVAPPSFSSSAPQLQQKTVEIFDDNEILELSSDDAQAFEDPIMTSSQPTLSTNPSILSERTTNLLANLKSSYARNYTRGHHDLASPSTWKQPAVDKRHGTSKPASTASTKHDDKIIDSSQSARRSISPAKKVPQVSRKAKITGNQNQQADKEAAKELKKLEKEQKAKQKQLAAEKVEVNKKRTDKKQSSEEMIVELPYAIKDKSLGTQVEALMKQVDVETRYYQNELDMTNDQSAPTVVGSVIKWRRKIRSRYNDVLEEYESCPLEIELENHILIYLTAEDFCTIAATGLSEQMTAANNGDFPSENPMKQNLDTYITLLRSTIPNVTIVLLLQGVSAFLKKSATSKNREYAAAVRAQNPDNEVPPSSGAARTAKKRKANTRQLDLSFFTTEHIEALTLHLQLTHQPLHIHHTTSVSSSANQISAFTQHLSTRPYRLHEQRHNLAHASFCMTSGQFKTGQGDPTDTFIKMLEQVNRITPSMATGILAEGYGTPSQLVAGFRKLEHTSTRAFGEAGSSREDREARERAKVMLQDVRKAVNKNGGYSDRRLGPAASKRLYKIFMSRDENLRDGIV